jgi:predicted Zn-ribbon and HTH transcriptional regulator
MTPEQKAKYLNAPYHCPKCESEDITGGGFEADYNQSWQKVTCDKCGYQWTDIYTMTDVEEV